MDMSSLACITPNVSDQPTDPLSDPLGGRQVNGRGDVHVPYEHLCPHGQHGEGHAERRHLPASQSNLVEASGEPSTTESGAAGGGGKDAVGGTCLQVQDGSDPCKFGGLSALQEDIVGYAGMRR